MLYVGIVPAGSGFGEYERGLDTERRAKSAAEAAYVYSEGMTREYTPVKDLPPEADIRGLVHREPERMYAISDGYGGYGYFGVA